MERIRDPAFGMQIRNAADDIEVSWMVDPLRPGDHFTVVERDFTSKGSRAPSRLKTRPCAGHEIEVIGEWKNWDTSGDPSSRYCMGRCLTCKALKKISDNDHLRNVFVTDKIKNVVRKDSTGISMADIQDIVHRSEEAMFDTHYTQVLGGWVGQVKFENKVIWQSEVFPEEPLDDRGNQPAHHKALTAANEAKTNAVKSLFTTPPTDS